MYQVSQPNWKSTYTTHEATTVSCEANGGEGGAGGGGEDSPQVSGGGVGWGG
jgi:hypothetical protein